MQNDMPQVGDIVFETNGAGLDMIDALCQKGCRVEKVGRKYLTVVNGRGRRCKLLIDRSEARRQDGDARTWRRPDETELPPGFLGTRVLYSQSYLLALASARVRGDLRSLQRRRGWLVATPDPTRNPTFFERDPGAPFTRHQLGWVEWDDAPGLPAPVALVNLRSESPSANAAMPDPGLPLPRVMIDPKSDKECVCKEPELSGSDCRCDQVVAPGGMTYRELLRTFEAVQEPGDWKAPIDILIDERHAEAVRQAVIFFTATEPKIVQVAATGIARVTAEGYRMGPAGP